LAEAGNLVGIEEKILQNFPHHHGCLRQKFWLALKKKFQNFPPHHGCLRRKICLALEKKFFKNFRTTTLA
jgi:hypothetical protein